MDLLLDTCTFLWLNGNPGDLPPHILEVCKDPNNALYVSAVSVWEIAVKHAAGKLSLPDTPAEFVRVCKQANGVETLDLTEEDTLQVSKLPHLHRDPFDRMLICQAITHGLAIVTPDPQINQYPIRVIW